MHDKKKNRKKKEKRKKEKRHRKLVKFVVAATYCYVSNFCTFEVLNLIPYVNLFLL